MIAGPGSDFTGAAALLDELPRAQWLLGDRGYDADWFRDALEAKGSKPCIPGRKSRNVPVVLTGGLTAWVALFAYANFIITLIKRWDALVLCFQIGSKKASEAVSPLQFDLTTMKLNLKGQVQDLNAFKVEVARTYVTGDVITRLEGQIDGMISSVQNEMRATRKELLDAVLGSRTRQ